MSGQRPMPYPPGGDPAFGGPPPPAFAPPPPQPVGPYPQQPPFPAGPASHGAYGMPQFPQQAVQAPQPRGPVPTTINVACVLLFVNFALAILATVLSFVYIDRLLDLSMPKGTDIDVNQVRAAARMSLYVRAGANVLVGIYYVFFVIRLRAGRYRAWRRLALTSVFGMVGLVYLLTLPYLPVLKVEQGVQIAVLAALAVCVFHPRTRAFVEPRSARGPMFGGR